MRVRKKELEPISTAFAGTDEELARRLQEEEMLAATPRTRTRARNPDPLAASLSKSLSTTLPLTKDAEPAVDTPARREPSRDKVTVEAAEPADSPSSRQDTTTAVNAASVAVTTARKRPAPDKPKRKPGGKRPSKAVKEEVAAPADDDTEQHSSKKQASPAKSDDAAVQDPVDEADEAEEDKARVKRRRRRDPVVPETPPGNGPSSVDSGDAPPGRRLRHSERQADRVGDRMTAEEAPATKRPRRPRNGAGRKLPKLPMVRQGMAWYRARTVHDDGQRIVLELTGFEGSDATLVLPLDSDRLWRGSYKGKDWRYLGDGAWAPKVAQHKASKPHRRGRGGPRSSTSHHAANGNGSADSDAHSGSSSSDDEERMDKHGPLMVEHMGPHPYGSMGDQNWQGDDALLKQAGSNGLGPRQGSGHSPRRRKSQHKPARAPMDGDLPAASPPCVPPTLHEFGGPMGPMLPLVPGTPPMDCCFYLHPAAMGLKPLSPDEVPPPPPPEVDIDDATELELVVAEAMVTCKEELTRHAWRGALSQGAPSAADEEEVEEAAAAVALLGRASFEYYHYMDDMYGEPEPDMVMVSPGKRGGSGRGRGGARRSGVGWQQGRRRGSSGGARMPSTARSTLGTFRILLDALGELDRPARLAAMALARSQLHHVLAVPAEALPGLDLLAPVAPPSVPLFC